ncbi:Putative ankyrin repeat protein MM_0045 [Durusdinium trenchii]|uniref:Ankyrin repeat protein MM_0045 n=1 Tax=Durusdinium trenchii TaxID=1381693 RepID=A0ABP0JNF9_9DINO
MATQGDAALAGCATWQRTALMIAARHGQDDVVSRALETSCTQPQLDVVDEQGNTALMIAAREGHKKVVDMLVAAGADLAIQNLEGQTAADLAHTEEIRAVIKKGEAQAEALLRTIMAMAKKEEDSMPAASGSAGSAGSEAIAGLKGLEMPKELMALVGEMDMPRFAAESPY